MIRGGLSHLLTRDLLVEIIKIAKDASTNIQNDKLEGFYKRYMYEIILSESFCNLTYDDNRRNRRYKVFVEVTDSICGMYNDEERERERARKRG